MPPRPLLLLLDFDSTLTLTSTIPLLLSLSTFPTPHPLLPTLSSSYTSDLAAHSASYHPKKESRKSVAEELAYLSSLKPLEKSSISRLENAGIWKGVTRGRIEDVAKQAVREGEVVLRKGWEGLVRDVQRREGGRVGVVSVGWSRGWIGGCLREGVRKGEENGEWGEGAAGGEGEVEVEVEVGDIDIRANELLFDAGSGEGTGMLDRYFPSSDSKGEEEKKEDKEGTGIWTAEHKLLVMHELIEKATRENEGVRPWTVYIGDSTMDLGCLMEADVGVCVRDEVETGEQGGLREVLERCGVGCLHVGEWKERMERGEEGRKCLWWARDFEEVRNGILEGG